MDEWKEVKGGKKEGKEGGRKKGRKEERKEKNHAKHHMQKVLDKQYYNKQLEEEHRGEVWEIHLLMGLGVNILTFQRSCLLSPPPLSTWHQGLRAILLLSPTVLYFSLRCYVSYCI